MSEDTQTPVKVQFAAPPRSQKLALTHAKQPEWEIKCWGRTRLVIRHGPFEVHELEIKEGGYCSTHRHRKINRFHVMSGSIDVDIFDDDDTGAPATERCDGRRLNPGDFFQVRPQVWHRFVGIEEAHILEVYWVDVDAEDIERSNVGGMLGDGPETEPVYDAGITALLGETAAAKKEEPK